MPTVTYKLYTDLGAKSPVEINDLAPWTQSTSLVTAVQFGLAALNYYFGLLNIKIPEKPQNAGKITGLQLNLYINAVADSVGAGWGLFVRKCAHRYTVDSSNYTASATAPGTAANWYTYNGVHKWTGVSGSPGAPAGQPADDYWDGSKDIQEVIGSVVLTTLSAGGYVGVNLDVYTLSDAADWDQDFDVWIKHRTVSLTGNNQYADFATESDSTAKEPELVITYDYSEENTTTDDEEGMLSFEPYLSNPEYPILKWKQPKDLPLIETTNGKYLLIRSTTPIRNYTTGSLLVREDSSLEHIDSTVADGIDYYYRLLFCDSENYVSGTGTGAMSGMTIVGAPRWSNEITLEKPKVTSFVESGVDYSWSVWETHTVNTVCQTPTLSGLTNDAYQYDWQGDATEIGWKELETPANTDSQAYEYPDYGSGTVTPKVRVRNSLGLYSAQYALSSAITLTALDALAEVRASPASVGTGIPFRLRADESQDQNSDGTITKFEFQVQRVSDSKYWTGAAWQVGIYWKDQTTTSYWDIIAGAVDHTAADTYHCQSRVTGLSTSPVLSTIFDVAATYEVAVNIRTTLTNSNLRAVTGQMEAVASIQQKLEGTEDVRVLESISSQKSRIDGISRTSTFLTEVLQIYTWQQAQTLLRYYYDESEYSTGTKYIDFRIDRFEERRRDVKRMEWAIEIFVVSKTT